MKMKKAISLALGCFIVSFILICGAGLVFGNTIPNPPVIVGIDLPHKNIEVTDPVSQPTPPPAVVPPPASDPTPAPPAAPPPSSAPIFSPPAPNPTPTPQPTPQPPAPTPTPPTPTPPPAPGCGAGGACSAAQVAAHGSISDCWVIYSNKVYNVTTFIPQHDGGSGVFAATCGHDVTSYLAGQSSTAGKQHKHSPAAYTKLNSYYIANLQ